MYHGRKKETPLSFINNASCRQQHPCHSIWSLHWRNKFQFNLIYDHNGFEVEKIVISKIGHVMQTNKLQS